MGACLAGVGGGLSAASHTLAGLPVAIGGIAVSLTALQDFEGAGIFRPRPPRGHTPPVKRRRGLLGRRMVENEKNLRDKRKEGEEKVKKVEDKRKHLEAGGDMGLPSEAEGGEAEGGDEGGGGDGGDQ